MKMKSVWQDSMVTKLPTLADFKLGGKVPKWLYETMRACMVRITEIKLQTFNEVKEPMNCEKIEMRGQWHLKNYLCNKTKIATFIKMLAWEHNA